MSKKALKVLLRELADASRAYREAQDAVAALDGMRGAGNQMKREIAACRVDAALLRLQVAEDVAIDRGAE